MKEEERKKSLLVWGLGFEKWKVEKRIEVLFV